MLMNEVSGLRGFTTDKRESKPVQGATSSHKKRNSSRDPQVKYCACFQKTLLLSNKNSSTHSHTSIILELVYKAPRLDFSAQ